MAPARVQLSRRKGWTKPENTVVVSRPTKWGNPFRVGPRTTRDEAVFAHKALMHGYLCVTSDPSMSEQEEYAKYVKRNSWRLRGKNLACWCRLDQDCHADILLKIANRRRR